MNTRIDEPRCGTHPAGQALVEYLVVASVLTALLLLPLGPGGDSLLTSIVALFDEYHRTVMSEVGRP